MPKPNPVIATGTPTPESWSQAYHYSFGSTTIFLVISLTKNGLLDLPMYGNKLAEDIYHQITTSPPHSLDELKHTVTQFLRQAKDIQINLGLAMIKNNFLRAVIKGQLQLILIRNHQPFPLLTSPTKLTGITGPLQTKDSLLLLTHPLYRLIQPNLPQLLKDTDLQDTLNRLIHAQTDSSQLSGIIFPVSPSNPPQKTHLLPQFPSLGKLKIRSTPSPKNKIVALILLLFFFLSVSVGALKRTKLNRQKLYHQTTQTIHQYLNQAKNLASNQPDQALNLLNQAQTTLQQYLDQHANDGFADQIKQLNNDIQTAKTNLLHLTTPQVQTFIDLNLVTNNLTPITAASSPQDHLLAFLTPTKIFTLNLQDKSTLSFPSPPNPQDLAFWNNQLFILYSQGVSQLNLKKSQLTPLVSPHDNWDQPRFISLYAGNIYLLDPNQSEIWKYPIIDQNQYGSPKRWLAPGITPDLSRVIDFTVDGHIWLLTSSNKLLRYLRGAPTKFQLQGFANQIKQPVSLALTDKNLFILNTQPLKILVFSKEDGAYLKQYLLPNLTPPYHQIFIDQNWLYIWHDHFLSRFSL